MSERSIQVVQASSLLDQVDGATIVSHYVENEAGLHLVLSDGRTLIFAGVFTVGLTRTETFH